MADGDGTFFREHRRANHAEPVDDMTLEESVSSGLSEGTMNHIKTRIGLFGIRSRHILAASSRGFASARPLTRNRLD